MPPTSNNTAALTAEREALEAWILSDPGRPVYSAVRSAFIEKFPRLYLLLMVGESNLMAEEGPHRSTAIANAVKEAKRLDKQCTKLAGLLFDRSNSWAAKDWRKPPIIKFLLRSIRRTRGGRPLTKLRIALQVKELKLLDPQRWTWPQLTAKFCRCGKEHSIKCQDNLRREVLHLEKFLTECGYPLTWEKPAAISPMR